MKIATLDHVPPIVKLCGDGKPYYISGPTIQEAEDGRERDFHPTASNSNIYELGVFGGVLSLVKNTSETRYVLSVELFHNFLTIGTQTPIHPLELLAGKQDMY